MEGNGYLGNWDMQDRLPRCSRGGEISKHCWDQCWKYTSSDTFGTTKNVKKGDEQINFTCINLILKTAKILFSIRSLVILRGKILRQSP